MKTFGSPYSRCRFPRFTSTFTKNALCPDYVDTTIGLEVHVQLLSSQKLFSTSKVSLNSLLPNSHVAPFDVAAPGALPVINGECVQLAYRAARALSCKDLSDTLVFDRKHYLYHDLPHGYQITQKRSNQYILTWQSLSILRSFCKKRTI